MAIVYLGLGSNLGDRDQNIQNALTELNKSFIVVNKVSSLIETRPQGGPPQGNFLNAVIEAATDLKPVALLQALKSIEKKLGRIKTVTDGPRTIDIDILLYDNLVLSTDTLTIPHPRMCKRDFVMTPLKEIAPQLAARICHANNN